jgi:CheY-like chemotaxis protein/HPt (histidine-containing phosphotransfer) domain-containing protein
MILGGEASDARVATYVLRRGDVGPPALRDGPLVRPADAHATNTCHWRQRPLDSRIPSDAETTEALRVLRERYRTTIANTVAAFRRLSAQLAVIASAPEVVEALRRELHRVHGAAGSFGFPEASKLAAELEDAAIRWVSDPSLDVDRRAAMTAEFANALEACVLGEGNAAPTSVVVPLSPPPTRVNREGSSDSSKPERPESCPDLIIVEDDSTFVEMLRYALESSGFTFLHYAAGPDALDALLAMPVAHRSPLVLLDVDLPGLDGFSLHERLRIERPGVYTTVFLTARGGEAEQLRAYRAGAIDYVAKPVNLRILMAKIPSWLERSRRGAGGGGGT